MFDNYQTQATRTFKEHTELSSQQARMINWAMGIAGESGELMNMMKHAIFHHETPSKMEMAKELGDILWYISAMCTTLDIHLSSIAELNIAKLTHRHGAQGYDAEASHNRHSKEMAFHDTPLYKCMEAKICKTRAPLNVIFIGPDGSGKTSIATQVAEQLSESFSYQKCDYRQEDKPQLCHEFLDTKTNVIYDRFYYPDDIIYSKIVHQRDTDEDIDWSTPYWKEYTQVLNKLCEQNTVFIYVDADNEILKERSAKWADDYVSVDELSKIKDLYTRYRSFLASRPVILHEIDTTEGDLARYVQECVTLITKAQAVFANLPEDHFIPELPKMEVTDDQV